MLLGSMQGDKLCNEAEAGKHTAALLSSLCVCVCVCLCVRLREAFIREVINCCCKEGFDHSLLCLSILNS